MSLDVYLTVEDTHKLHTEPRIFVREDGQTKQITRAEWDERFPNHEPVTMVAGVDSGRTVYRANITHNLNTMANAVGVYKHLWRPDEIGITEAKQLIKPLRRGLTKLEGRPEKFKEYNPDNGWGNYEGLVNFIKGYLAACRQYPNATVSVSR